MNLFSWLTRETPHSGNGFELSELQIKSIEFEGNLRRLEVDKLNSEITFRLQQEDKTYQWLVGSTIAVAGLKIFSESFNETINSLFENPWSLAVIAILLLWFPISATIAWSDIAIAAVYLRKHSYPALENLNTELRVLAKGKEHAPSKRPDEQTSTTVLHWEEWRANNSFNTDLSGVTKQLLYAFRGFLLYVPTLIVYFYAVKYWANQGYFSETEGKVTFVILAIWVLLAAAVIYAYITESANLKIAHSKVVSDQKP